MKCLTTVKSGLQPKIAINLVRDKVITKVGKVFEIPYAYKDKISSRYT